MNPSARSALTLAVLLVLPQLQALCPRLAPDVISGKVIPCRYLCIKINFLELPSIVLSTERDGVLCSTLLLRRRGVCKNGGCMPFGSDDDIKPKGALGKVIAAIDKFASGSYRTKAPKPGTPFGPIVSTASSLFGGGSSKTSGSSSSTSSAASSIVATATAAAVGSTFKKLFAHGASVLSEKKKHDEHPFSSILTSVTKPDHHPAHNPGGTVSSSSGAVAVSFGGGPPVLPPSTEGGTEHDRAHTAPQMPSASSPGPSEHPSLPPFISASQPKPKDSLGPGSASGAPSSNGNVIKHAIGIMLGTISGVPTSGTPSASVAHNGPTGEASGGGGATPAELPFGRASTIVPPSPSLGTKRNDRESLSGFPTTANVIDASHPRIAPAAPTISNIGFIQKPSTFPSSSIRSPPIESPHSGAASQAENSAGSHLNGPYAAAFSRLKEIAQGPSRNALPGQPSLAAFGGTSVPSSGSSLIPVRTGASGPEVNHNKGTVTNPPSAGVVSTTTSYSRAHPSLLPPTAGVFESKREETPLWSGAPKTVSQPLNTPTEVAGIPPSTSRASLLLHSSNPLHMESPSIGTAPLRSPPHSPSEGLPGSLIKTPLVEALKPLKQGPAGTAPVTSVRQPVSPVTGETSIPTNNPRIAIAHKGANKPVVIPTRELYVGGISHKPVRAAVKLGGGSRPVPPSNEAVAANKGREGSQFPTVASTIPELAVISAAAARANAPRIQDNSAISPNKPSEVSIQTGRTSGNLLNFLRQHSGSTRAIPILKKSPPPVTANLPAARAGSPIQTLPESGNHPHVIGGGPPSVAPSRLPFPTAPVASAASKTQVSQESRQHYSSNRGITSSPKQPSSEANAGKSPQSNHLLARISDIPRKVTTTESSIIGSGAPPQFPSSSPALTPLLSPGTAVRVVPTTSPKTPASLKSPQRNLPAPSFTLSPKEQRSKADAGTTTQIINSPARRSHGATKAGMTETSLSRSSLQSHAVVRSGAPLLGGAELARKPSTSPTLTASKNTVAGALGATKNVILPGLPRENAPSIHTDSSAPSVKSGGTSQLSSLPETKKGSTSKTVGSDSRALKARPKKRFFRGFFRRFKHKRKQNHRKGQSAKNHAKKEGVASPSRDLDSTKPKTRTLLNTGAKGATLPVPPAAVPHTVPNPLSTPSQRKEEPSLPKGSTSQATKSSGVGSSISNKSTTNTLAKTEGAILAKIKSATTTHNKKESSQNIVTPVTRPSHGGVKTTGLSTKGTQINLPSHVARIPEVREASHPMASRPTTISITPITSRVRTAAVPGVKQGLAPLQHTQKKAPPTVLSSTGTTDRNTNNRKVFQNVIEIKSHSTTVSTGTSSTGEATKTKVSTTAGVPSTHGSASSETATGTKIATPSISSIPPGNTVATPSTSTATTGSPSSAHSSNELTPKPTAAPQKPALAVAASGKGENASYGSNPGSQVTLPRTPGSREATQNGVPSNIGAPSPHWPATSTAITGTKIAAPSISSISRDNTVASLSTTPATTGAPSSAHSGNQLAPIPIAPQQNPAPAVAAASKGRSASYGSNQGSQVTLPSTPGARVETQSAIQPSIGVRSPHGSVTFTTVKGTKNSFPGISSTSPGNTVPTPLKPAATSVTPSSARAGNQLPPKSIAAPPSTASAVAAASYGSSQGSQTRGPMGNRANAHSNGETLGVKRGTSLQSPSSTSARAESKMSPSTDNSSKATSVSIAKSMNGTSRASERATVTSAAASVPTPPLVTATLGVQPAPLVSNVSPASRMGGTLATTAGPDKHTPAAGSVPSSKVNVSLGPGAPLAAIPTLASATSGITSTPSVRNVNTANPTAGTLGTTGSSEKHTPTGSSTLVSAPSLASSVRKVIAANRLANTLGTTGTTEKRTPTADSLSGLKGSASLLPAVKGIETPRPSPPKPTSPIANAQRSSTSSTQTVPTTHTASRLGASNVETPGTTSVKTSNVPSTAPASATVKKAEEKAAPGPASNLAAGAQIRSALQNISASRILSLITAKKSAKTVSKSEPRLRTLALSPEGNASNNAKAPAGSAGSLQKGKTNSNINTASPASSPGGIPILTGLVKAGQVLKPSANLPGLTGKLGGLLNRPTDALRSTVQSGRSAVSNILKTARNNEDSRATEARPPTTANVATQPAAAETQPSPPAYQPSDDRQPAQVTNDVQQGSPMYPGMQAPGGMVFGRPGPMPGGFWGPPQGIPGMYRPF
ncbi:uncharacterized protein LOC144146914 [Haemaphysalis longicornis]